MNQKALHTLEFDKIRDKLTSHAATPMGKEEARALIPSDDFDTIVNAQKETSEAVSMILKKGLLSLGGLKDIRPSLQRTAVDGVLSIEELLYVGDFLYTARRAKSYAKSENKNDSFPLLEPMFDSVETADKL
ncbi:MAG: endonuclease MutS2, partial [Firmicutes bacterium]|nr:endonuclease MutS2 [Bacillota bacterium]